MGHSSTDKVYPLMSAEQRIRLDEAIKISFTGDLILLREMIERAYNPENGIYEFNKMFEHVSDLWQNNELSIGVLEGPLGGEEAGYSTSNFDDGVPLSLNYPDSFACAIKDAGIGLVSLANNHIFDVGIDAGLRTMGILESIGLDYVGLLPDKERSAVPKIINVCGKRVGVLAYTYGQNGKDENFFFGKNANPHLKAILAEGNRYYKKSVELVIRDFQRLKEEKPDLIIVLPHMGRQFLSKPDKTQRKWCDLFVNLGADIIFSDHAHHVQPIEWRNTRNGKRVLIVHCPGNFINSYVGNDGDASMVVRAYLDRNTLEPFAVGVTPIYAHCPQNAQWTGLPTYKALVDEKIYSSLSRADMRRINRVNRLVTGISIDAPMDVDAAQKEYISFPECGFVRDVRSSFEPDKGMLEGALCKAISQSRSVCFVGDSITDGTKNGGYGWYEPLISMFPNVDFLRFALGSQTSKWVLNNAEKISALKADLYVVAIGCNDIRYRNPKTCSMTAKEYVFTVDRFVQIVREYNCQCRFVFLAPWRSLPFDANFNVSDQSERVRLYNEYTMALAKFCKENNHIFLNPNPLIFKDMESFKMRTAEGNEILKDFIHPTAYHGVGAYCRATMSCDSFRHGSV